LTRGGVKFQNDEGAGEDAAHPSSCTRVFYFLENAHFFKGTSSLDEDEEPLSSLEEDDDMLLPSSLLPAGAPSSLEDEDDEDENCGF
jgi:hypothetical protein